MMPLAPLREVRDRSEFRTQEDASTLATRKVCWRWMYGCVFVSVFLTSSIVIYPTLKDQTQAVLLGMLIAGMVCTAIAFIYTIFMAEMERLHDAIENHHG